MTEAWTTAELLTDIRDQARLSEDEPTATDAVLLREATRQMRLHFVPLIRKVRSEYYQIDEEITIEKDVAEYDIPSRASTSSLRSVVWVDSAGETWPLTPMTQTDRFAYGLNKGYPEGYAVHDNRIVLIPTPGSALGTLKVTFEYRPGNLVLQADCALIDTVAEEGPSEYVLTITKGANYTDSMGDIRDIVQGQPPFSLRVYNGELTDVGNIGGVDIEVIEGTHDRVPSVGDWVCEAGDSPIPQIPPELHPVLALATAVSWLRPIDPSMASVLKDDLDNALEAATSLISPRQQGAQQKMRNPTSHFRSGGYSGRRSRTFGDWS